jgi:anti-sigma-K factor RskA
VCAECAAKLQEANGRVALLSLTVNPEPVPAVIKERLLRQIREEAPKTSANPAPTFLRWLAPALAVAALVLIVVVAQLELKNHALRQSQTALQANVRRLQDEAARERSVLDLLTAYDTVKVTLVSGASRPVPEGRAFYHLRKGLIFYASNLPVLPSNRTYQLWLVPAVGNPISAGVFRVDTRGDGQILLPNLPPDITAKAFAVTLEPAGGVPQPTGPKVLIGAVS